MSSNDSLPKDPAALLAANPTRSDVQQASYQAADKKTPDQKPLSLNDFAPENLSKTTKRLTGYGPNREAAKALYQEAEDLFRKASEQQGEERTASFLAAAGKFNEAAERLPDSALQQDALYMAGDSFFFADAYSQANDAYEKLVKAYPNNRYLDVVDQRRFTIAKYWIQRYDASPESWWAVNVSDRARPWRDTRGHALRVFDKIRLDDPTGRLADDATLAAGNERFAKGEFIKADDFYADLRKNYPTSEHQFTAHFLGLKAKLLTYRGADYSGKSLDESEKLIKQMRRQFPRDSAAEREFLDRSWAEVRYKKAERDWNRAAYHDARAEYRAAALHYGVVAHDYSDTPFGARAEARLKEVERFAPVPAQQLPWLVGLFPEADKLKPLIDKAAKPAEATATKPTETQLR